MWDDPDEILLGRNFILAIPANLPTGEYRLVTGLYDPESGIRLTSVDGEDHLQIEEISVTGSAQ